MSVQAPAAAAPSVFVDTASAEWKTANLSGNKRPRTHDLEVRTLLLRDPAGCHRVTLMVDCVCSWVRMVQCHCHGGLVMSEWLTYISWRTMISLRQGKAIQIDPIRRVSPGGIRPAVIV